MVMTHLMLNINSLSKDKMIFIVFFHPINSDSLFKCCIIVYSVKDNQEIMSCLVFVSFFNAFKATIDFLSNSHNMFCV